VFNSKPHTVSSQGPRCSVCRHPELRAISADLASGMSARAVGRKYGFTPPTICKHVNEHIGEALIATNISEPVLEAIRKLNTRTLAILRKAEDDDDPATALQAIRESRCNLQLVARLTGELKNPEPSEETKVVDTYVDRQLVIQRDDDPPLLPPAA